MNSQAVDRGQAQVFTLNALAGWPAKWVAAAVVEAETKQLPAMSRGVSVVLMRVVGSKIVMSRIRPWPLSDGLR